MLELYSKNNKYTTIAILLHWLIALLIISQFIMGLWMVPAINDPLQQAQAFKIYQLHKSIGLTVLLLVLLRFIWRITHRPPPLPSTIPHWEAKAAHTAHYALYALSIIIPLLGWAMVSVNPYGLPTMYFDFFQWPDITWLANSPNKPHFEQLFKASHKYTAYIIIFIALLHGLAALKHHFLNKDEVLIRMLPFLRRR